MEIVRKNWGKIPEGVVERFTMTNRGGYSVGLTNLGAAIVSVEVADKKGVVGDVALGYDSGESYLSDGPAMGKSVGRVANRTAKGRFELDGKGYKLETNNGPNHLHGGSGGFANRIWNGSVEGDKVVFRLVSEDGDQGYPGRLEVEVAYGWSDECELKIEFSAKSNAATVVNLTNHAYFNLSGEASGSVLDHKLRLNAGRYLPTDDTQIPTGEIASVEGTPMDFRSDKALGKDIDADFDALKIGAGYDSSWVTDGYEGGALREVASLYDPQSGREMTISSTQACVQVYTGNYLSGSPKSKSGHSYANRDGVAIECQGFTDAANKPEFPSIRLDAGQEYRHSIHYKFGKK